MACLVALELSHTIRKQSLALSQSRLGEFANRRAARAAMLAGVCIQADEQLVGKRNHDFRHTNSVPGITRCQVMATERAGGYRLPASVRSTCSAISAAT